MSRPNKATLRPSGTQNRAHANKPTPEREHASKQASRGKRGGGGTTLPHHPQASTQASTQTPKRTRPARKHETQPPASKHAHSKPKLPPPRKHKSAHARTRGQARCVSAGTRGSKGRPARTKRKRPTRARRTTHTTSAQTTRFAYGVRLRPQGRTAREKAAHNSPRQSAWVVVFVGVFADVCRRFWAGWFGCLGVFWGCLACFLVF